MRNMNYFLAKAIQKDHLRDARQNRLARLIEAQKQAIRKVYRKKERA